MKKRSIPAGCTGGSDTSLAVKTVQLKITLRHSKPPIWRRVVVSCDIDLISLHNVIQAVMGWDNSHPHLFVNNGTVYSLEDLDGGDDGKPAMDEADFSLDNLVARTGATFAYEYDFGDRWWQDLKVEKIEPVPERPNHAVCLAGACAAPPDDSGGVWGYYAKLAALADPKHQDYEYIREWFCNDFDPARFELDNINKLLRSVCV